VIPNFSIITSQAGHRIPLLLHIPHSGKFIPPEVRRELLLDDGQLARELTCMTDAHTDELFAEGVALGGCAFINNISRLVVDPERFPNDEDEIMSARGMGAVYCKTSDLKPLRSMKSYIAGRAKLLEDYYFPYAEALSALVCDCLAKYNCILILDCHSFPSKPLPYEIDQEMKRPEICIGTDSYHTPKRFVDALLDVCHQNNITAELNRPFSGTYVPFYYYKKDERVNSFMIEVRRDLYLDESTGGCLFSFNNVKRVVDQMIRTFVLEL